MAAAKRALPLVAALALTPAVVTAQAPTTEQLPIVTLQEAVELALRVQPSVVQALGAITSANASRREVMGSWLPTVNTSGSWARNSTTSRIDPTTQTEVSSPPYSYSAGWNASLQLFDGFRRFAQGKSAGADLDAADANLTNQQFQVTLQVKQAFFNALAADELIRVSQTQLQRADEQLKVAKEKLAAGSATRSDTLRSAVEVGNAQLLLLNAKTSQASTRAALARLIGYDHPVQAVADSSLFQMEQPDTAALRAELLQTAPSVVAAEASAKSAAAAVAVAKAQYFPTLNGSFSQSWSGTDISKLGNSWAARLSLNWPLFNGFTREGNVTRSNVSRESADAQAEDARRLASAQLTQQLATLESSRSQIDISRTSLAAAQEDLRVVQERYRLGAATIVDVLTSQQTLDQAEVDYIRARLDFLVARAQLEALVGRSL